MAASLRRMLDLPPDEILATVEPEDPRWRGLLYDEPAEAEGSGAILVSGFPLSSSSDTRFMIDGTSFQSVLAFYCALKLPEGDPRRVEVAERARPGELRRLTHRHGAVFQYNGRAIAVGSPPHLQLVARATVAKVRAHPVVQVALLRTGRARLGMGRGRSSQPLGRAMPFALMVERYRLSRGQAP